MHRGGNINMYGLMVNPWTITIIIIVLIWLIIWKMKDEDMFNKIKNKAADMVKGGHFTTKSDYVESE